MNTYQINSEPLTLEIIHNLLSNDIKLELSQEAIERIKHCREYLDNKVKNHSEPIYGITTGFGSLCNIQISADQLTALQENLVMSHACGTGDEVNDDIVRIMLLLKAHALSSGNSGVQVQTVQRLLDFYNNNALPIVYEQGSLGASGDLAPLAHLSLPLIGLGEMHFSGKTVSAKKIIKEFGWEPITLQSKEGLALLNGTQFMSAHAVYLLLKAKRLSEIADVTSAVSIEAYNGKKDPFFEQLHTIRPHQGQIETARNIRALLDGSKLINAPGKKVQDPYSFRCIPQVHGAVRDTIRYVESVVITEINSVTDNPTIFPDEDLVLSGGNFHGEPLAFVLDFLSIALAELGNISERRVYRLISGQRDLPEFLVANPGLNSGFMIPQYTAASIVSQNKQLATPSSVDSITSSNEQEDHVSMGANAATKALRITKNLERIIAIELFTAAQALDFRGLENTSPFLRAFISEFRSLVPFIKDDTIMYTEIAKSIDFVQNVVFDFPD
ncbi:MAG: histidine ammonia-lyase [Chloroflexota bacterium]|nr:histidine ammonia-lyase [Lentimicrobium sp.]